MGENNRTILALDISTTCTGWALFSNLGNLLSFGTLKPNTKGGVAKMKYPRQQLVKMMDLGGQILELIKNTKPDTIVIEEVAGSKNRLTQKVLDGLHFIVAEYIQPYLDIVTYYDVTGSAGWRTALQLRLSEADKDSNKKAKVLNKKLTPSQRIPIIGPKHLACRHANSHFNLALDCDLRESDGDIADAVCMGHAHVKFRLPK